MFDEDEEELSDREAEQLSHILADMTIEIPMNSLSLAVLMPRKRVLYAFEQIADRMIQAVESGEMPNNDPSATLVYRVGTACAKAARAYQAAITQVFISNSGFLEAFIEICEGQAESIPNQVKFKVLLHELAERAAE